MRVRYDGPYGSVVVDGIDIPQGGEAEITEEQFERVKHRGVEVVETKAPGRSLRNLTERTAGAHEGGTTAEEV